MKEPNPGSAEAVKLGCTCPVMDNHDGKGFPMKDGDTTSTAFWINGTCQLHGTPKTSQPQNNG